MGRSLVDHRKLKKGLARGAVTFLLMMLSTGCAHIGTWANEPLYYLKQAIGQVEILAGSRSVEQTLRNPELDPLIKRRLRIIQAARTFARDELGLTVTQQYRRVTFIDEPAVVYVVSAAPRTSLDSYLWTYPVLGRLPYRGFFSLEDAEREADLKAYAGLDVSVRPVTTYSLLGVIPDPIVSPMLQSGDELSLIETVIHELAHATVFVSGAGAFNEGMATFIGREGRKRFVEKVYGRRSAIYELMRSRDADRDSYARAVAALAFELRVLFAQAKGSSERHILDQKEAVFTRHQNNFRNDIAKTMETFYYRRAKLPDNNARLAAYGIYSLRQDVFQRAYDVCNYEMKCLIRYLLHAARHKEPMMFLEGELKNDVLPEKSIGLFLTNPRANKE